MGCNGRLPQEGDEEDLGGIEVAEGERGPGAAAGRDDEVAVGGRIDAAEGLGVSVQCANGSG